MARSHSERVSAEVNTTQGRRRTGTRIRTERGRQTRRKSYFTSHQTTNIRLASVMTFTHVSVKRYNDVTPLEIPIIAEAGDEIEVDCGKARHL